MGESEKQPEQVAEWWEKHLDAPIGLGVFEFVYGYVARSTGAHHGEVTRRVDEVVAERDKLRKAVDQLEREVARLAGHLERVARAVWAE